MNEVTAGSIVTGPITGGSRGRPFAASMLDVAAHGYTEAEYLLGGTATRYQLAPGADLARDGRWRVGPAGTAPFRTRMLVYRPNDAARFNGTVILTWNNVTAGYDLFGAESLELFEGGYALVCLTPQKVGKTADFMYKIGTIKTKPASWKELFFPEVHGLAGD